MTVKARKRGEAILVSVGGSRVYMTATVAPHTRTRARALAARSGLSLGQIMDRAMMTIELCEECRGHGSVGGELGEDSAECPVCRGERVVPQS